MFPHSGCEKTSLLIMEVQEIPIRKCAGPTANHVSCAFSSVLTSGIGHQSQNLPNVRTVSSASPCLSGNPDHITSIQVKEEEEEEVGEEISKEEESVCRICFGVCEEGNTLRMGCSCKGALRLVHEECLVKWFNLKGNRMCDVCGNEVSNIKMTWLHQPIHIRRNNASEPNQQPFNTRKLSAWQEFFVLFIFGTMWYFFFLELLMIGDLQAKVILIAAPVSVILGLLASILAVSLSIKEYIWKYAVLEWGFVTIILQILYYMLHMKVVYVITISSVLGFGMVMGLNYLYIQYFIWRFNVSESSFPAR